MRARRVAIGAAIIVAMALTVSSVAPASADSAADAAKTAALPLRGISVAGGEFSGTTVPTFDTAASFAFLAKRGYTVARLPFLWESVQPTLGAALDEATVTSIKRAVRDASSAGLKVILDLHNYARYKGVAYGETGSFSEADFADLWTRISSEFRNDPAVLGYGLMNEPHDLPQVDGVSGNERWQQAQQAALTAIRDNGDVTCVLVSGYSWSSLAGWFNATGGQPEPYITDPADNFRWEAHDYWDMDSSGRYTDSYAAVEAAPLNDPYRPYGDDAEQVRVGYQLDQWITWLEDHHQKGYLGEFGWPSTQNANSPTDAAAWNDLATDYLRRINQTQGDLLWTTAWATGAAWGPDYELLYYRSTNGVLTTPLSNAAALEANARERNPLPVVTPPPPPPPAPEVPAAPPVGSGDTTTGSTSTDTSVGTDPGAGVTPAVVRKSTSKVTVTVAKARNHPKVTIRVKSSGRVTGSVTILKGKRVLARSVKLRSGKAVVTIKATLPAGKYKLVVKYAGTTTVASSSARVTVRVTR